MPKRKQPGALKRLWWRFRPPRPAKKKAFERKKLVPFEEKVVEGKTYLEASKQWNAAKEACKGDQNLAYYLSEIYRELGHPLLLKETREERHHFEQRLRDRERAIDAGVPVPEEITPQTFVKSITPEDAAKELLVLGAMTPRPKRF